MTRYVEVELDSGRPVLLQVSGPEPEPDAGDGPGPGGPSGLPDLPGGGAPIAPVGRRGRARVSAAALEEAVRPLGALLGVVDRAVRTAERTPEGIEVEFGIRFTQDLRLGIVGAGGEAALTVRASWRPEPGPPPPAPATTGGADTPAGTDGR
jgi:hypothetical protein